MSYQNLSSKFFMNTSDDDFEMVSYRCIKCLRLCAKDDPDICNDCVKMSNLRMYIAILDEVPSNMVPVLVAHSVLGAHVKFFSNSTDSDSDFNYRKWLTESFRKVTVKVNQKEFDKIAALEEVYLGHENTTLGGKKSCAIVCPREEYPNVIKFAKLYTP